MLPFLTADLPGIGGQIKIEPEDFVVDEVPVYEPCGEGEHLFLWVEKRDTSAEDLLSHLSRSLNVARRDVGMAGLKDRRAVTRQYVSVPAACEPRVPSVESDRIRVFSAVRHRHKLRSGHLKQNRFDVLLRNVSANAIEVASQVAERIERNGFPNYYGAQRFGHDGQTLRQGLDLLSGALAERDLPRARHRYLLRLSLSAVQSHLFNQALAARIDDGLFDRVIEGDVMQVAESGGPFVAEDVAREQARFDSGETDVSGPLFGPKMRAPAAEAAERERQVLQQHNVMPDDFRRYKKLTSGSRRSYRARAIGLEIAPEPLGLRFRFTLRRGSYATVLLAEFTKAGAAT